jgi:hypothetical protein
MTHLLSVCPLVRDYTELYPKRSLSSSCKGFTKPVTYIQEARNVQTILVQNSQQKTLDRRPRCTWKINNIFNIREISFEAMGLTDLSQGGIQWLGFVNTGMNF